MKAAAISALLLGLPAALSAATLINPSFEADTYTAWPGYTSANGPITGWTTSDPARTGINSNPPTWQPANTSPFANNGAIPHGTQAAFIQIATAAPSSSLSTTVSNLVPGQTYRATLRVTARNHSTAANQRPNGTVEVAGQSVSFQAGPVEAGGSYTQPYRTVAVVFTATQPTETFRVTGNLISGQTDAALVLDDLRVAAGGTRWFTTAWVDDATSGINPALSYSHAYNLGSAAGTSINGVNFTGVSGGNPAVPGSFSTSGWTVPLADAANNINFGGSAILADDFVYGGASQTQQSLTLEGLTAGQPYRLSLYGVGWADANVPNRSVTLSDRNGDLLTVNEQQFGADNGLRIDLSYIATGATQTFDLLPTSTGTTFHLYGFANAVIPEPGSAATALLGAAVLGLRRRRAQRRA